MIRKIIVLFIFILIFIIKAFPQMEICGYVFDENTRKPLEYVSVYLKNKTTGTVSNTAGLFFFNFNEDSMTDTLVFSLMGYEKQYLQCNEIENNLKIYLTPRCFNLSEVEVVGKRFSSHKIVKKASRLAPDNADTSIINLKWIYRSY